MDSIKNTHLVQVGDEIAFDIAVQFSSLNERYGPAKKENREYLQHTVYVLERPTFLVAYDGTNG